MYRDNSLVPKEAIRLAARGLLVERDRPYGDLAREVREFAARIVGPSLELLGTSIELLRFEGLIAPVDGQGMADAAVLRLTDAGRAALTDYLTSTMRPGVSDRNTRSEERRVGVEWVSTGSSWGSPRPLKKKKEQKGKQAL